MPLEKPLEKKPALALPKLALAARVATDVHSAQQAAPVPLSARSKNDLLQPLTKADLFQEGRRTRRVPTGIPGLDGQIEGGFEEQSVVLVAGDSGSGKTTFTLQYLYNGAAKFNEPGIFITFEEKKRDLFRRALRYGWDFVKLEKEKKLAVLEYPPHEIDRFLSEGNLIEDIIRDLGAKRLVIDSITSFALLFENEYKRRQGMTNSLNTLKKWGCTTLLSSEAHVMPNGELKSRFELSFLSDALIYLYNLRRGDSRIRAFEIMKMRGTNHSTTIAPMSFEKNGIVIYPDQPVFGGKAQL